LAASIRPGKVTLEFQKEGLLRNQEETSKFIPYLDRLCSWDVLDKAIPKTAPSGHPAQYDLNLLLSIQAAAQTILGGEEEPPIHIHHNGHNPTFVTTFCLKNFAALILPKQEWDQDERVLQW
jgi:hypothetical protein